MIASTKCGPPQAGVALRFTGSNSWHTYASLFSSANVTYLGMLPIHCMQAVLWSNACVVL